MADKITVKTFKTSTRDIVRIAESVGVDPFGCTKLTIELLGGDTTIKVTEERQIWDFEHLADAMEVATLTEEKEA